MMVDDGSSLFHLMEVKPKKKKNICNICWAANGQKWKISETTEILLKYATFLSVFFNFLLAKYKKIFPKNILATALKSYIITLL